MALLAQRAAKKVSPGAGLKSNQRCREVRGKSQKLLPGEFLPNNHLAGCAKCYEMKGRLAEIDANRVYLHVDDPPA